MKDEESDDEIIVLSEEPAPTPRPRNRLRPSSPAGPSALTPHHTHGRTDASRHHTAAAAAVGPAAPPFPAGQPRTQAVPPCPPIPSTGAAAAAQPPLGFQQPQAFTMTLTGVVQALPGFLPPPAGPAPPAPLPPVHQAPEWIGRGGGASARASAAAPGPDPKKARPHDLDLWDPRSAASESHSSAPQPALASRQSEPKVNAQTGPGGAASAAAAARQARPAAQGQGRGPPGSEQPGGEAEEAFRDDLGGRASSGWKRCAEQPLAAHSKRQTSAGQWNRTGAAAASEGLSVDPDIPQPPRPPSLARQLGSPGPRVLPHRSDQEDCGQAWRRTEDYGKASHGLAPTPSARTPKPGSASGSGKSDRSASRHRLLLSALTSAFREEGLNGFTEAEALEIWTQFNSPADQNLGDPPPVGRAPAQAAPAPAPGQVPSLVLATAKHLSPALLPRRMRCTEADVKTLLARVARPWAARVVDEYGPGAGAAPVGGRDAGSASAPAAAAQAQAQPGSGALLASPLESVEAATSGSVTRGEWESVREALTRRGFKPEHLNYLIAWSPSQLAAATLPRVGRWEWIGGQLRAPDLAALARWHSALFKFSCQAEFQNQRKDAGPSGLDFPPAIFIQEEQIKPFLDPDVPGLLRGAGRAAAAARAPFPSDRYPADEPSEEVKAAVQAQVQGAFLEYLRGIVQPGWNTAAFGVDGLRALLEPDLRHPRAPSLAFLCPNFPVSPKAQAYVCGPKTGDPKELWGSRGLWGKGLGPMEVVGVYQGVATAPGWVDGEGPEAELMTAEKEGKVLDAAAWARRRPGEPPGPAAEPGARPLVSSGASLKYPPFVVQATRAALAERGFAGCSSALERSFLRARQDYEAEVSLPPPEDYDGSWAGVEQAFGGAARPWATWLSPVPGPARPLPCLSVTGLGLGSDLALLNDPLNYLDRDGNPRAANCALVVAYLQWVPVLLVVTLREVGDEPLLLSYGEGGGYFEDREADMTVLDDLMRARPLKRV